MFTAESQRTQSFSEFLFSAERPENKKYPSVVPCLYNDYVLPNPKIGSLYISVLSAEIYNYNTLCELCVPAVRVQRLLQLAEV
jgi:hypothetical protein